MMEGFLPFVNADVVNQEDLKERPKTGEGDN